ncbi:hypothetical protein DPMN_077741 [Dreissena polymorpha]|uniref:Uncharacterized protein n=1 Tax=Dreissena polymorpha TaxID=45954 RepID=A0A9D3YP71_DREPO|nr:hypothetical protein DPMN_077741 [Dreissena polymorpha]
MVDIERQSEAITETSFNTLPVDEQLYILINSWPTLKTFLKPICLQNFTSLRSIVDGCCTVWTGHVSCS